MFVVAPFNCFVVIAAAQQEYLHRKIYLREARKPDTLVHSPLFHHERCSRLERNQQPSSHLKAFRQTRLQPDHLLVNRIDPHDANQFGDQSLLTIFWTEPGTRSEIENDRLAALQNLTSR